MRAVYPKKNWYAFPMILMILVFLLGACTRPDEKNSMIEELSDGEYYIYYLDEKAEALKPVKYKAEKIQTEELLNELIGLLIQEYAEEALPPYAETVRYPLEENVAYREYTISEKILYLYFDTNYLKMNYDRQILAMGAFAKTLTQVPGIEHVDIFVGDKELTDSENRAFGPVSGAEFVDSISDVNAYQKAELNLYFADKTGEKLIEEKREVFYNANTAIDKVILAELILGPKNEESMQTFPSGTKLISSTVEEGICYVNFNSEFLTPVSGQKEYIAIYSLVNSLTEIPEIQKVQISVDGSKDHLYRNLISLDTFFERDTGIRKE